MILASASIIREMAIRHLCDCILDTGHRAAGHRVLACLKGEAALLVGVRGAEVAPQGRRHGGGRSNHGGYHGDDS